ncbi:hypothetical protein AB0L66_10760 [Streptomyces sp. NPDC052207]|uniref:hypothetical protein n=1 Tax=Streptomyces sp. NPDC052207 TaxID=3155418 RepID=UPI00342FACE1
MNIVGDLYFDWQDLAHGRDCPLPVWEPQLRMDQGFRGRLGHSEVPHECAAEDCRHASLFRRFTLRLVCRSCTRIHILTGEHVGITRTTTVAYGYGQQALEMEGLWLWPGERTSTGTDDEPREWLVTRTPREPVTPEDVAGTISRYLTAGYHRRWQASAIADPTGPYGDEQLRWARREGEYATVAGAAGWIAAQYQPQTIEVAV